MVNITYLKKIEKDVSAFCAEWDIKLELPVEILSLVLSRYFLHCEKNNYTDQIDLIKNYPLISPNTIIRGVRRWADKMKLEGKSEEDFYGKFKSQKRLANDILLAMWHIAKDKEYNTLNIRLKPGVIRFVCSRDGKKKAQEVFERIRRNKAKPKKVAIKRKRKKQNICTVPHSTELFQGRERNLTEVLELINSNKIVAVTGPPGQGKTELVRAVAHTLTDQGKYPDGIFWVSAREDEREYPLKNLDSIFNAVLKSKKVPDAEKIQRDEKREKVSKILESGQVLLVLDNFETLDGDNDIITYLYELSPEARVLIATRHDLHPMLAHKYTLNPLDNDGVPLFLTLLKKAGYFDDSQRTPEAENVRVKQICRILDGHPLSLVLTAGNVLYDTLEETARRLQESPYSILQSENRPPGTPIGLWKSIDLSLSRLEVDAREIFQKLSIFFAPVNFDAILNVLGKDNAEALLREMVQRNLLKRNNKGEYFFLPALKMVSRNLLEDSKIDLLHYHKKAAEYFKRQEVPATALALDHLEWFYQKGNKLAGREMVNLMLNLEGALFSKGYWTLDGEKLNRSLLVAQKINYREGEIDLLTRLGWLVHHKWDLDRAEELHLKALSICKKLKDLPRMAYQWKHLGWVYTDKKNLDKAKEFYKKSLEIQEQEKHYHNQADIWNALGTIYRKQGNHNKAERAILYAVYLATRKLKKKHRHLMRRLWSNLGMQYWAQGQLEDANRFLLKSLHSAERSGNIPVQIDNLRNLGQICLNQGKFEQAEETFKKLLSLAEQTETLRFQAAACHHLGQIYRYRGNFIEAERFYKKELDIHVKCNNLNRQAGSWCNLGVIYRDSKRFEEAEQAHKKAQAIYDKLNSTSGTNWHKLGLVYSDQKKLTEAEQAFKRALTIYEKRDFTRCLVREWNNLASVYHKQGKSKKAQAAIEKAQLFAAKFDGVSLSRFKTDILCDLGIVCLELEKSKQTEQLLNKILQSEQHINEIFGQAIYLAKMGILYEGIGNIHQAIVSTEKALEIFNQLGNTSKSEIAQETLHRLQSK